MMASKTKYDEKLFMELRVKLPYLDTESDRKARMAQWSRIDFNGNGVLSLAELDKGMRDVIKLPVLFNIKPVMLRAFYAAKDKCRTRKSRSDYVERREYKWLLQYLKQYFEYWVVFDSADLDSDGRVTWSEFEFALPLMSKWGIDISEPRQLWNMADANGGGVILFDEFIDWVIK